MDKYMVIFVLFVVGIEFIKQNIHMKKYSRLYDIFLTEKVIIIDKHQRFFLDICMQKL